MQKTNPRSSESIFCQLWPSTWITVTPRHKKIFWQQKIFPTVKIFWWTPLFIKQWMDSVRFILKIVREREREKPGPVSFWLRPLFASSVIFCGLVIAGYCQFRPPIGQFRSRDRHAAFSLVSSSKLLNSDSFNWGNSTQKYRIARGSFMIEQWSKILWFIQTCPLWILANNRIQSTQVRRIFLKSLSVSVPFLKD